MSYKRIDKEIKVGDEVYVRAKVIKVCDPGHYGHCEIEIQGSEITKSYLYENSDIIKETIDENIN